ncbi:MAG TPA: SRPBCC family protein [Steroidobacteraceae bacterium]
MDSFDRIEKRVILHAPMARVWQAITDAKEFGRWFGINLDGEFVVGKPITGTFNAALNEAAIHDYQSKLGLPPAKVHLPDKSLVFCTVECIEPREYFSFRWIPYGIDADIDPETEPTTLVEFRLRKAAEGTVLTIVESGFDRVPAQRRERAFRMNEGGWTAQAESIRNYIEKP